MPVPLNIAPSGNLFLGNFSFGVNQLLAVRLGALNFAGNSSALTSGPMVLFLANAPAVPESGTAVLLGLGLLALLGLARRA